MSIDEDGTQGIVPTTDPSQQKETAVSIEEIVRTCSHEQVAQAAVASLGMAFAVRLRTEAAARGLTTGAFVAQLLRDFDAVADAPERRAILNGMHRADQPVLCGLRLILESRLDVGSDGGEHDWLIGPLPYSLPAGLGLPIE